MRAVIARNVATKQSCIVRDCFTIVRNDNLFLNALLIHRIGIRYPVGVIRQQKRQSKSVLSGI